MILHHLFDYKGDNDMAYDFSTFPERELDEDFDPLQAQRHIGPRGPQIYGIGGYRRDAWEGADDAYDRYVGDGGGDD